MSKMKYQEFYQTPHLDEGCALFYREAGESKFHILIPLSTIPSFISEADEIEYGYTTMAVNGLLKGRKNAASGDTDFYWTMDYANKLKSLSGKELDMLVVLPDWQGWFFRGQVEYNYNEISRNDLVTGTLSITPTWIDEYHTEDVEDFCMDTAWITSTLDTYLTLSVAEFGTSGKEVVLSTSPTTASIEVTYLSQSYVQEAASTIVECKYTSDDSKKITLKPLTEGYETIKLTISASEYATWDTYIKVETIA